MRAKRPHLLHAITRLSYPRRFVFFDSESTVRGWGDVGVPKVHVPRLIVAEAWEADESYAYRLREERSFQGDARALCDDFWGWLDTLASGSSRDRASVVVVGHNVGYDVQVTGGIPRLQALGWSFDMPYAKGPVFIWRASKNRRSITILSSTNYYQAKLSEVGDAFDLPKLDTDTQTENLDELRTYCRRDVAIARAAILGLVSFLRENDVGPWADTISSIAFKAYRYRFLRFPIELHTDASAEKLERDSYAGGRTEAFFVGHPTPLPCYKLDVNSLYPSVMGPNLFPTRLLGVHTGDLGAMLRTVETGGLVIADVEVEMPTPALPKKEVKLLFPVGRFRATLCSPELKVAIRQGQIIDVGKWTVYDGEPIFAEFVAWVYAQRLKAKLDGKAAWAVLFKAVGNHLYGKFGQRRENWERVRPAPVGLVAVDTVLGPNGEVYAERTFDGWVWRAESVAEAYNSFPAIASFVTSYARVRLWSLMNVAGNYDPERPLRRAGREFYYCDTDSLFVSEEGYRRLDVAGEVHPTELGRLKVEDVGRERVVFYGAKWYEFDGARKRKGVPENARATWADGSPVLTPKGESAVVYDSWPRLLSALRAGNLDGFANRPVIKKTTVTYDKGVVWADGWVQPLRFPLPVPKPAEPARAKPTEG